jgi:hypothetical protein
LNVELVLDENSRCGGVKGRCDGVFAGAVGTGEADDGGRAHSTSDNRTVSDVGDQGLSIVDRPGEMARLSGCG